MKKRKRGRKLSRKRNQRKALLKSLAETFILGKKIKTTEAKAKELRPFVEKIITKAKKSDLATKKYLMRFFSEKTVKKLQDELVSQFKERKGGYTRIVRLGPRKSDGAKMVIIELC